jgi:tetratricopeptide (TPR) repeat protein
MRRAALLLLLLATPTFAQRLASDFEIAQMEQQLARSRDFTSQLSGRLNLGDVRAARNERSLARAEYEKARELAARERRRARLDADLTRYATATSYAALAQAKLGRDEEAFVLAEEAVRYTSDSAKTWNLYASTMNALGFAKKSVSAARNAVAIAERNPEDALDLALYRYALAAALGDSDESLALLVAVTSALRSSAFASLKDEVARTEAFEIYSTARGDAAAYLSLLNRSQLRLGAMYERRGEREKAREQFERVLETRSDDPTALAALGRWEEAFEANPFSMTLIREYRRDLPEGRIDASTTGGKVRLALAQIARGENRAARETLDALIAKFPANETLLALRRETERRTFAMPSANPTGAELRALADAFETLTPEQRAQLDTATFTSVVTLANERWTIDGVPVTLPELMAFTGTSVRLTYRILGPSRDGLLIEPVEVLR